MTKDKSLFKTLKEKVGDYVTFGDGSHAQVLGKGTIEIPRLPLLKDVLYIKGLKANLLSISQICDEDFLVQFSKKGCLIINEEGICKVEFNQPFYWLYSVPNLLVFQHLVTLYLGGLVVRVVSEIE